MADKFERSGRYITEFVKWLAPEATVKQIPEFIFRIDFRDEQTDVRFDRSEMEDFEVALERFQNTNYIHTLENRLRFRVFIALGAKGLIPYLQISSELLREKGEWLKNIRIDVAFDANFSAILYQGLQLLSASIGKTLASGLNLPEVEAEKQVVDIVSSKAEVDVVMEQAKSAGATIVKPAQDTFWGGYAGYFQDPDQHL